MTPRQPLNAECVVCSKPFRRTASQVAKGVKRHCSMKCRDSGARYKAGVEKCYVCKKTFPLTDQYFYRNTGKPSGFSTECKPCKRQYQLARNRDLLERRRAFVVSVGSKCSSCGVFNEDTSFFDIDHIVPVVLTKVARSLPSQYNPAELQVLCPNCHRLKTIGERKYKRARKPSA